MSKIKIETLTSVHVGSGETLQYGMDFVSGLDADGYGLFGIIDPKKILNLIGEKNIGNWIAAIERRYSTKAIVKQFAPQAKLEDYSKRILLDYCDTKANNGDTLKELIHDGMGKPYIPGSSIKGAIRTAVLATLAKNVEDVKQKIDASKYESRTGQMKKQVANAKKVEATLFGGDPNSDVFRFLQVGDAIFETNCEEAHRMFNINEREKQSFWDTSKPQMIETIGLGHKSQFQLKVSSDYYDFARKNWPQKPNVKPIGELPDDMKTLQNLFKIINANTCKLVGEEISYYNDRVYKDDSDKVSGYINKMNEILTCIKNCKNGSECVLRIGHGSGWRFITGAWTEKLDNFTSLVVPVSRPKNDNYKQYDFPKTRRVDDQCELLGFVKLTIIE